MVENYRINLTKKQKEAIAEQLADFFFDFWQNRNSTKQKREIKNSEERNVGLPHKD